jgi:putative FmdB family regulatory protein
MPIYEYQCQKCAHHLEALQKISDKPLRECPECGRHTLKRLMSAPMFRLAGSGWYETDFKSDKEQKRNLLEKGDKEPAKSEGKVESKPETKPETKPEAKAVEKAATSAGRGETKSRTAVTKPAGKTTARGRSKPAARRPATSRARKR